jgi:hypothetical protein
MLMGTFDKIETMKQANDAEYAGAVSALIVAIVTMCAVLFRFMDTNSLIDSLAFFLVAWRVSKHSRMWSVVGLVGFIVEKIYMISVGHFAPGGLVVGAVITCGFILGVRGTWAYRRLASAEKSQLQVTQAAL